MFNDVDVLIGSGAQMDAARAQQFLEENSSKIREAKPLVEVTAKKAGGGSESFRVRLSNYVPQTSVIALGGMGDSYQGLRRLCDVDHLKFV